MTLAVLFITLEVVGCLDVKRDALFQPMLPPLGQRDQDDSSALHHTPLGEHNSLFKRDFSPQTPVIGKIEGESPPCAATQCLSLSFLLSPLPYWLSSSPWNNFTN